MQYFILLSPFVQILIASFIFIVCIALMGVAVFSIYRKVTFKVDIEKKQLEIDANPYDNVKQDVTKWRINYMKLYIIGLISAIGIFTLGCLSGYVVTSNLDVKQSSKQLVTIDKNDTKRLYEAYKEPIVIETNTKTITATDGYKITTISNSNRLNTIYGGVGILYAGEYSYFATIGYLKQLEKLPLVIGGSFQVSPIGFSVGVNAGYQF